MSGRTWAETAALLVSAGHWMTKCTIYYAISGDLAGHRFTRPKLFVKCASMLANDTLLGMKARWPNRGQISLKNEKFNKKKTYRQYIQLKHWSKVSEAFTLVLGGGTVLNLNISSVISHHIWNEVLLISSFDRGCTRSVMVKPLDCRVVVSEFELQSRYYVHFWIHTLGKGKNLLILPSMG